MNVPELKYPLEQHKKVLAELVGYYREYPGVYAVVLTGSLARGKAVKDARAQQCSRILKKPEMYQELADLIDGIELSMEALSLRSKSLEGLFAKYGFSAIR